MKRVISVLLVGLVLLPLFPDLVSAMEAQYLQSKTVWENPWTLTTFHADGKVNSTFFSFPKVVWTGSQWVNYIFNSSDMSGGIGSVYVKFRHTYATIYDPNRTEVRIQDERWIIEWYDESINRWRSDASSYDKISCATNSSGIFFIRTSVLQSGSILKVSYILKKGASLKYLIELTSATTTRKYRIVWKLGGINGARARLAAVTKDVTRKNIVRNTAHTPISWIQFLDSLNNTKVSLNWFDTFWFNETTGEFETYFQGLELDVAPSSNQVQAKIWFGNYTLSKGESAYLDPTTVTFSSEAARDGTIRKQGKSYPPRENTVVYTGANWVEVGQQYYHYGIHYFTQSRGYVSFNTISIPSLAYNLNVKLKLKTMMDYSDTDFVMQVRGGEQPLYGDSLDEGDWNVVAYEMATWDTANYPGDGVYIDLTIPPDQVNKVGLTQFQLRSNREVYQPTGREWVRFYSGDSSGNEPKLEVTYYIDTETINGTNWYYRNVYSDKAVIILFGGYTYSPYNFVKINCIDHMGWPATEKSRGKVEFIDGLIANEFSVLTNKDDPMEYVAESTWVEDAAIWLRNRGYEYIYLFGFSAGGTAVAYEIQKDYATIFSAAVIASAPVDWDEVSSYVIFQSAHTADEAKVCTSFLAPENDFTYSQMELYYNNMIVHKEWHRWTDGHDPFPNTCADHPGETVLDVVVNWYLQSIE